VPGAPDRSRGDLRTGALGADVPNTGRGRGEGQQHSIRAVRRGVDGEGLTHPVDVESATGRRGVGQHVQPIRPDEPVRWLQGKRIRPRGWSPRAGGLPAMTETTKRPASTRRDAERDRRAARLAVKKTYKLYIGGKFPRSESGRSYEVTDSKGRFLANAAWASRKDARDAVAAARKAFPGWSAATAYNRGQVLYRVADVMEGRFAQCVHEVSSGEGRPRAP